MGNTDQKEQRKKSKSDSLDVSPKKSNSSLL